MRERPVAHLAEDGRVHGLEEHLCGTAYFAAAFAGEFGCAGWGRLAGIWHDLGKYSHEFQRYILDDGPRTDHSSAGALYAVQRLGKLGRVIAYLVAGHHAGLLDWADNTGSNLERRLTSTDLLARVVLSELPPNLLEQQIPAERPKPPATDLTASLWLRMLFSCLVDADFLDTEAFFNPAPVGQRSRFPTIEELLPLFDAYMADKQATAFDTPVNRLRAEILRQSVGKAFHSPGFFSLTVPTGGGKTLSSMAFALNHARAHGKRRIIYVIPYTSIIEQTADQFREVFGDSVVEHHSNVARQDSDEEGQRLRLASENWDAPVIVTTSVQFFESLFASRTSRCRKLHNIVNSVVVLDEAQLLPPDFLNPILEALKELQKNYGTTVVICTATQPALGPHQSANFDFKGIPEITEIMDDPAKLHVKLKRTRIHKLRDLAPVSWDELAEELEWQDSALCIVNRRDDARTLWEKMPKGTIHLSALMCGAHRARKIAEIKERLRNREPTRVISTQLVEAGVDVDFPIVYRAAAGLDSIAQAAGRCNREGLLEWGEVFVFTPPSKIPAGHLQQAAGIGMRLLAEAESDPLSMERFEAFFREFYWMRGDRLDRENIIGLLRNDVGLRFSFRTAARKFQLIDESAQAPVIVQFENDELLSLLERQGPERWLLRKLQRSVVNLPRYLHNRLLSEGAIRERCPGIFVQAHGALYHPDLGFCPDKSIVYEPDELIG
ncbi:metal dependent phosphohydrolase [Geobacter metallireducens RCH3]|uniref:CRISPR-associated nuclease and helicase Cas3 n=1 Tax=Geobacter metallireducens (strain ATCC 53774 / DSM 7210 / GS-15) TaxID=269799 RepID=Q39WS0_GEOMG|nr:CRISPR-associated helicase/endonuclease Cas3 [Geobacter metallireducens]ABB31304.1 CRISPR-associated nuclease and helicase Cas3 [Geobacter metallireducens GS-15]EHP86554.1 metal dependent phosphohydrolase [Geobacter metallireducens RCH3]